MAFEIARVHGMISSSPVEPPPLSLDDSSPFTPQFDPFYYPSLTSLSQETTMDFPSPRTWKATRGAPSSSPSLSPSQFPNSSLLPLSGMEDTDFDFGAEIAEWMAQSCMEDEENDKTFSSFSPSPSPSPPPSSPPFYRSSSLSPPMEPSPLSLSPSSSLHYRTPPSSSRSSPMDPPPLSLSSLSPSPLSLSSSNRSSSSISWGSNDSSQGASPTSVLSEAGISAWDVLFRAAGEVQKLARERDNNPNSKPRSSPKNLQKLLKMNHGNSPLSKEKKMGQQNSSSSPSPSPASGKSSPSKTPGSLKNLGGGPRNSGSEMKSLGSLNSFNAPKNESGTGVFLPRAVSVPSENDLGNKKVSKPTTVLLPARLVQALGLNVDQENNVVLKRNPPSERNVGKSVGSLAVMKLVPDDSSVVGNGNRRTGVNGGNGGNGVNGCKKQGAQKGKGKGQRV